VDALAATWISALYCFFQDRLDDRFKGEFDWTCPQSVILACTNVIGEIGALCSGALT